MIRPYDGPMPTGKLAKVDLDSGHCRAICDEIGDRLRYSMKADASELPIHLRRLLARFEELDRQAPSVVPSLEDMRWQSASDLLKDAI
jgi:hypothetical protein